MWFSSISWSGWSSQFHFEIYHQKVVFYKSKIPTKFGFITEIFLSGSGSWSRSKFYFKIQYPNCILYIKDTHQILFWFVNFVRFTVNYSEFSISKAWKLFLIFVIFRLNGLKIQSNSDKLNFFFWIILNSFFSKSLWITNSDKISEKIHRPGQKCKMLFF